MDSPQPTGQQGDTARVWDQTFADFHAQWGRRASGRGYDAAERRLWGLLLEKLQHTARADGYAFATWDDDPMFS